MVDMAHIAGLVAAGEHQSPVPYADFVTSTTHKTLRGPRGGLILCKEKYAKALDKNIFPGMQGGPLMHIIAAKAVCFKEALEPAFKTYMKNVVLNCRVLGEELVKYTVPNETRSPFVTSGIRIGTAAVTTRGFDVEAMKEIASIINDAIENRNSDLELLRERVKSLCAKYPLYS